MNTWEEKILDRQEAHETGLAEGMNRANEETALRMKEEGFEYEMISKITKLPIEDIKAL